MVLLSLGCANSARLVHMHLAILHARHPIRTILDARCGTTAPAVYEWLRQPERAFIERIQWQGDEIGIDLVRAVVAQAFGVPELRVIVWGLVPVFVARERRPHLDVQMGEVMGEVLEAGLSGWAVAGVRLVALGARPDPGQR